MKRSELLKLLKQHGCKMIDHGSNHDKFYSPITNRKFIVWRHKAEIPTGTLHEILKQSGIELR